MAGARHLGRYTEPALWTMVALRDGPRHARRLYDDVRAIDGPIGPGTLFATVARLERLALVEATGDGDQRVYRLTARGLVAGQSVDLIDDRVRS